MAMQKPENMGSDMFASLVQGIDVLYSEGFDHCAVSVKTLMREYDELTRNNRALRGTVTNLNALRDDLIAERDSLEKQLEVKTNEARGLADQLHVAKTELELVRKELADAHSARNHEQRLRMKAEQEAERLEGELQERVKAHSSEIEERDAAFKQTCREMTDRYKRDTERCVLMNHEMMHMLKNFGADAEDFHNLQRAVDELMGKQYASDLLLNPWLAPMLVAEGNKSDVMKAEAKRRGLPVHDVKICERSDMQRLNELAFGASTSYLAQRLIDMAEDLPGLTPIQSALIAAAGDRLGVDTWPSLRALRRRPVTKGELAEALYPESEGYNVDCAVPHDWVRSIEENMFDSDRNELEEVGGVAAQFVTVYDSKARNGCIMPVTRAGITIVASMANR